MFVVAFVTESCSIYKDQHETMTDCGIGGENTFISWSLGECMTAFTRVSMRTHLSHDTSIFVVKNPELPSGPTERLSDVVSVAHVGCQRFLDVAVTTRAHKVCELV